MSANTPGRDGLIELFSGDKTSVSFPYTAYNGYTQQESWTFLRREPFSLNGRTIDSVVFEHETVADPRGRSDFHGRYTHWLNPKAGIWLRTDLTVISGSSNLYAGPHRVHTITIP